MVEASRPTCLSLLARPIIECASARGLDRRELFAVSGLSAEACADPDHRMPDASLRALWQHVIAMIPDPALPFEMARMTKLEDYHLFGFAVMSAPNGREALNRANRYFGFVSDTSTYRTHDSVGGESFLELVCSPALAPSERAGQEHAIASYFSGFRQFLGQDGVATRVCFQHESPGSTAAHREFFRAPIEFGASRTGFAFPTHLNDAVPRQANPGLSEYLVTHAEAKLAEATASDDDPSAWVRETVSRSLSSGTPSIEAVARQGGVSERTLRRMLAEQGFQFRHLLDDVRRERAEVLLANAGNSMTDIAFSLGFSEVSAFSRAFKRWVGATPREFRAAARTP